ncbi:MAG: thiamine-phosphate kinase [Parvularculaceae bacterium]
MSGEFDIIARHFAPLATDPGAFGLTDDAALLAASAYIVTKDVLVEGVHFLPKDPRDLVARKSLRVNLSDLAAKGAKPVGYFLGCVWPAGVKEDAIGDFARGLGEDQETFRIALLGGDTTVHVVKGAPLTISITMFGYPSASGIIRRNGAAAGDDLYVTGTIGDAGLGLRALTGAIKVPAAPKKLLGDRYRLPLPRLAIGGALAGLATSAIDVSDGLLADAGHLARQSGVAIDIASDKIPLSETAAALVVASGEGPSAIADLASCGDDYEILFTAPPSRRRSIEMASQVTKTPVARIGSVTRGSGVRLIGENGNIVDAPQHGFDHFSR